MEKRLKEIALAINAKITGNEDTIIKGISGIKEAQEGDITFLANPKYRPFLETTHASAVIVSKDITCPSKTILQVENPSLAFTEVINMFKEIAVKIKTGIDKTACISKTAKLAKNVNIGSHTVIGDNAVIEEATTIYPNCYIGNNAQIGRASLIYPNVTIRENSKIGRNVIIHSGTVIGSDGFGYIEIERIHHKIPQVGIVVIEDDVEIGANVAIDRARFGQTIIGKGTKIDNLVQIAHNVKIGANSIIISQTGISGSTTIGENVILAGQAGLAGHLNLGDNVIVGAQAGVTKSFPSDSIILGSPAKPISEQKKIFACISRLPELFNTIKKIKEKFLAEG